MIRINLSITYGSLIAGAFTLKWSDFSNYTIFNFSITLCSNPTNVWAAIGLSMDDSMV